MIARVSASATSMWSAHLRRTRPFDGVLANRDEPLDGPIMQRLRKARTLALFGVDDLGQEALAVGREPRDLGCAFVGHVAKSHEVVASRERGADGAKERNRDDEHEQQCRDSSEPRMRPHEDRRRGHQGVHELVRKGREARLAHETRACSRVELRVRRCKEA